MSKFMKYSALSAFSLALVASVQAQTTYFDATGDLNDGTGGGSDLSGFAHLDIASVEINNDATDIMFTLNFVGDILATDWGKYMIGIDSVAGGDTAGNGWGRPISMSSGMDYWVGSWVDSGDGAETYHFDGGWILDNATWNPPSDISVAGKTATSATLKTSLSSLGLSAGNTFAFDVFSSGGGGSDSAIDALSDPNPSVLDWGGPYDSQSTLTYTVVVPEPATLALGGLGLAALLVMRRRKA